MLNESKIAKVLQALIPFLGLLGAGFAIVSLYHHTQFVYGVATGPSFCNISAAVNCDAVNASPWAVLFGVPLASYGLVFYLGIILFSLAARDGALVRRETYVDVVLALALIATLASVALFGISEFVIGTLCLMCIGMYISNITLLVVTYGLLADQESLVSHAVQGVRRMFSLPGLVLSGNSNSLTAQIATVRGYFFGGLVLAVGIYFLPMFLYSAFMSNATEDKTFEQLIDVAFKDWQAEIAVDIAIDESPGENEDFSQGPVDAPIQLVEFADYECPACRMFYRGLEEQVLKVFPGKIRYIYRNYPLDMACNPSIKREMHKTACYLTAAARCAGEQGKFWEMTDFIFLSPVLDQNSDVDGAVHEVNSAISMLNIDSDGFASCLSSDRIKRKILKDISEGDRLGLSGTPSLWLNGKKVRVTQPIIVRKLVERLLQSQAKLK